MKTTVEHARTNPRALSCFLSLVSFGILIAGLHVLDLVATGVQHVTIKEEIRQKVLSAGSLQTLVGDPLISTLSERSKSEFESIAMVHGLLGEGQTIKALERLKARGNKKHPLKGAIEAKLQAYIAQEAKLRNFERAIQRGKAERDRSELRYVELQQALQHELKLIPPAAEHAEVVRFSAYETGLLAGLPMLPGVPAPQTPNALWTQIEDTHRRSILAALGDRDSELSIRLAGIRQELNSIQASHVEATDKIRQSESDTELLVKSHAEDYKELLRGTRVLAGSTLEPELDAWTKGVYATTRQTIEHYGVALPELG